MPLISKESLLKIADRCAAQYKILSDAFNVINQSGTNGLYHEIVNSTADVEVQIPLLQNFFAVDQGLVLNTWIQDSNILPIVSSSMDIHFNKVGSVGSWDGFLTSNDCRVSEYFNQVYRIQRAQSLLAKNVFCEQELLFGTLSIASDGAPEFTDGYDFGRGENDNIRADGGNFAPQQLKVRPKTLISNDLELTLSVKNWQGDVSTIDVLVVAGAAIGLDIPVGTATDRFMDVVGFAVKSGSQPGAAIEVYNLKERTVAL